MDCSELSDTRLQGCWYSVGTAVERVWTSFARLRSVHNRCVHATDAAVRFNYIETSLTRVA